jgi:hypothetical protein
MCGNTDSLQHRLTQCVEGSVIWNWTHTRLAAITHTDSRHIPEEWTLRPDFHFWPPPKQAALLWILANLVEYQTQSMAIVPTGLYELPPPDQMESLSTSSQTVRSRKVSGDTLAPQ